MSCRLDDPVSADDLDCQQIYSRKERRLQYLLRKERLMLDLLVGLLSDSEPLAYGPLSREPTPFDNLWNGILDASQVDEDRLYEEIYDLERWLNEYSGV
jgi:hypothetical protein